MITNLQSDQELVMTGYRRGWLRPPGQEQPTPSKGTVDFGVAMGWLKRPSPDQQMTDEQIELALLHKSRNKHKQA